MRAHTHNLGIFEVAALVAIGGWLAGSAPVLAAGTIGAIILLILESL